MIEDSVWLTKGWSVSSAICARASGSSCRQRLTKSTKCDVKSPPSGKCGSGWAFIASSSSQWLLKLSYGYLPVANSTRQMPSAHTSAGNE